MPAKDLGPEGLITWQKIVRSQGEKRDQQIYSLFGKGIVELGIESERLPNLESINQKLGEKTGFRGMFVEGLEEGKAFYQMLSERIFPIGNFIRDHRDIHYTPAPDIVHDLYGHLPFLMDPAYADFCQKFGEIASQYTEDPQLFVQFERFFWFTIEFGLILEKTPSGIQKKVFGAGIASSMAECEYALSAVPQVFKFDIDQIRHQDFRIDEMQKKLFLIESEEQLYCSLPELHCRIRAKE